MLISFSNCKGGVGKSTLSAHLATYLHDRGHRVALLDTDPQQTAARWVAAAEPGITVATAHEVDDIRRAKAELLREHEVIVADSPGSSGDAAHTVTLLADLVVVPLQPSKPDVRAVKDALKFVRLAQEISGGSKPMVQLVLTFTAKGDVQTRLLRHELTELGLPITRCEIRRLNAFRDACDAAVTRQSSREAREAAKDIEALFAELLDGRLSLSTRHAADRSQIKKAANG